MNLFSFTISAYDKETKARVGRLSTPHGEIDTPAYLSVGTQASVKAVSPDDLYTLAAQGIFANTYHLYLRPGPEIIAKLGGLHKFMRWDGPIFTDSGGYQVFSLGFAIEHNVGKMVKLFGDEVVSNLSTERIKSLIVRQKLCKVDDSGATFVSYLDGSLHLFTPEISMRVQQMLGSDIVLVFDECTSPLSDYDYTKISMRRSHLWAERSFDEFNKLQLKKENTRQAIYGIIQGGPFEDLRIKSAKFINKMPFFGIAIGGALVNKTKMKDILSWVTSNLSPNKPKHLLGIGTIEEIFSAVGYGIDTFDSTGPTREARAGGVFVRSYWENKGGTKEGKKHKWRVNLTNEEFKRDGAVLEKNCGCYTCRSGFSRAYLRHLFFARELLVYRLLSIHNLFFIERFMNDLREAISKGSFTRFRHSWLDD